MGRPISGVRGYQQKDRRIVRRPLKERLDKMPYLAWLSILLRLVGFILEVWADWRK